MAASNPSSSVVRAAIDREAGPGDRAGAERILVGARVRGAKPDAVALELLDDRQQVMRDRRRLRGLRMGVRGEHVLAVRVRQIDQHLAQPDGAGQQRQNHAPLLHPVHRHVDVVARTRGVQPAGGVLAAGLDDQALDVEEQIFAGAVVA